MKPAKRRWANLKYRQKIRNVLLTYYLTPILLILLASGGFFYFSAKKSLDAELGQRLISIGLSAAYQVHPFQLAALELKDVNNLTYRGLLQKFQRIEKDNQIAHVYLFNLRNESLVDSNPTIFPGTIYERNRLHQSELESNKAQASILFQGTDGSFYKSAFIPLQDNGQTLAYIGVDGNASFFTNLHLLGKRLALFGLVCIIVIVIVSMLISRKIVVPIQLLVGAAERIGDGHLEHSVQIEAHNEIGFLGFVMDEMRQNIVNRDRELQMMLRGIAHEVRNPLGGIELYAGMLNEEVKDESSRKAVGRIQNEVKILKNLVEEFLDFARKSTLQTAHVDLTSFFNDVRIPFQKEVLERKIDFSIQHEGISHADFDADQMRRAFLNLVRNSLQAIQDGGHISIHVGTNDTGLDFCISDNGCGIPGENVEKLFDPFFTTKEGGTGLGLSFVKKIVADHGGEVRIESTPGSGTEVHVLLPR